MKHKILVVFVITFLCTQNAFCQEDNSNGEFKSNIIMMTIVANDLEDTIEFYTKVIGMKKVVDFPVDEEFSKNSGLSNGIPYHVTILQLNDKTESSQIRVTSFADKPDLKISNYIQDKIGVQYLTFQVNSMKPFIERIKTNRIKFLGKTPIPMGDDSQFVLIQDPNGIFIELMGKK